MNIVVSEQLLGDAAVLSENKINFLENSQSPYTDVFEVPDWGCDDSEAPRNVTSREELVYRLVWACHYLVLVFHPLHSMVSALFP